jgi:hypothetical protein
MNKLLLSCVVGATLVSAQAQWLFSPDSIMGAGLGAMIGGISGGNCHNGGFSGNDAAIGAGIGLLAGTLLGEARRQSTADEGRAYAPAPPPNVSFGYGYWNCGSSSYVYYSPNYYTAPGYYCQPPAHNQVQQPAPAPTTQDTGLRTQDAQDQITSRPCSTSTCYWTTPPPQIADAPRVPDAPSF